MSVKVTERDTDLIKTIYKYRYLSLEQIIRLFFPSKQMAEKRLRQLITEKYLKKHDATPVVFLLNHRGHEVAKSELHGTLPYHTVIIEHVKQMFLEHTISINDFRISLTLACKEKGIELVSFIPCYWKNRLLRGESMYLVHEADALIVLKKDDIHYLYFLEVDKGTETLSGVLKMVRFYVNHHNLETYKPYETIFQCEFKGFKALVVTNSSTRLENMREKAKTVLNYDSKHIVLAMESINENTVFDNWVSLDVNDNQRYSIF